MLFRSIENYAELKKDLELSGYHFTSETDTEVVVHAIHHKLQEVGGDLLKAVQLATVNFEGAYALGVVLSSDSKRLIAARQGSPLVIGVGVGEHFIASDVSALLAVTQQFIFMEDGDVADIQRASVIIYDKSGQVVERPIKQSALSANAVGLDGYRHYMHKEIFEQPQAVINTLQDRIEQMSVKVSAFSAQAEAVFKGIDQLHIIACGTSYHAGLVAKYWSEDIVGLPCQVEVASEFRYRNPVIQNNTLFVFISQSGETADTLAALQKLQVLSRGEEQQGHADQGEFNIPTLAICNVAESSLMRESDLTFMTQAGPELGVASTKAFTTQLIALALLVTNIGKVKGTLSEGRERRIVSGLRKCPDLIQNVLSHEDEIKQIAEQFSDKQHALFLGRGAMYPIALEGSLKLKEISYIHAEAYPAGELKHGPLALIDEKMPVIAIAPLDGLLEKLKSNLQEVKARGGLLYVFEDEQSEIQSEQSMTVLKVTTHVGRITAPIVFNVVLQLLAYHVALIKGTDVDQPRNLAKSVTVE